MCFERRRRGKARCLAITAKGPHRRRNPQTRSGCGKGAAPLRGHCDAGQEKESTTISGGLTKSLRNLHVRRCSMQLVHYTDLRALLKWSFQSSSFSLRARAITVHGLLLVPPRGAPARRGRGCAKKGYAGGLVEEASTLAARKL